VAEVPVEIHGDTMWLLDGEPIIRARSQSAALGDSRSDAFLDHAAAGLL
jgi:hypothetical protein